MAYEYLVLTIFEKSPETQIILADGREKSAKNLQEILNAHSADGWELTHLVPMGWSREEISQARMIDEYYLIFKRPGPQSPLPTDSSMP